MYRHDLLMMSAVLLVAAFAAQVLELLPLVEGMRIRRHDEHDPVRVLYTEKYSEDKRYDPQGTMQKFSEDDNDLDGNSGGPSPDEQIFITGLGLSLACCSAIFFLVIRMDRRDGQQGVEAYYAHPQNRIPHSATPPTRSVGLPIIPHGETPPV